MSKQYKHTSSLPAVNIARNKHKGYARRHLNRGGRRLLRDKQELSSCRICGGKRGYVGQFTVRSHSDCIGRVSDTYLSWFLSARRS